MLRATRTRLASTWCYWAVALDGAASLTGLLRDVSRAQGDRRKLLDNDSDGEVRDCLRQCIHSLLLANSLTGCHHCMLRSSTFQLLDNACLSCQCTFVLLNHEKKQTC